MFKTFTRALFVAAVTALFAMPSMAQAKKRVYTVDNTHSNVLFKIGHFGVGVFYGQFLKIDGTLTLEGKTKASVTINVDANSVSTNNEKRDKHLKSPDFFNAKQFPKITFEGSGRGLLRRYRIKGTLTFHGVKKKKTVYIKVSKEITDSWKKKRIGATATFSISRKAFGVKYMPKGLSDKVTLIVSLELVRK